MSVYWFIMKERLCCREPSFTLDYFGSDYKKIHLFFNTRKLSWLVFSLGLLYGWRLRTWWMLHAGWIRCLPWCMRVVGKKMELWHLWCHYPGVLQLIPSALSSALPLSIHFTFCSLSQSWTAVTFSVEPLAVFILSLNERYVKYSLDLQIQSFSPRTSFQLSSCSVTLQSASVRMTRSHVAV